MKKVLFRVFVIVICISMMLVFTLAGCKEEESAVETIEENSEEETVQTGELISIQLKDFQSGANWDTAYDEIIAAFIEAHPEWNLEITRTGGSVATYNEELKPMLAAGTAPDIFCVYPGPDVAEISNEGQLIDLTQYIDADSEWRGWLGDTYNYGGSWADGKMWVLPQDVWNEGIWYYKDLLKEAGGPDIEFGDTLTVDDLISIVDGAEAIGVDVVLAGFIEQWGYVDSFFNFVHQLQEEDPSELDYIVEASEGRMSWQQDVFHEAINAHVKLNEAGVWSEEAFSMDYQVQAFGKWKEKKGIFMWGTGDWFAGEMNPEDNTLENPNIGMAPFPIVNENSTLCYNKNFGSDYGIYSKGENIEICLEFLKFTNSPDAAEIWIRNSINPAAGVDPASIPETDNPTFNDCVKLYLTPGRVGEVMYPYADAYKAIADGIGNVLLGLETIDSVLANLDSVCGN